MKHVFWFFFILSFSLSACSADVVDIQKSDASSPVLYSAVWGLEHENVSVLTQGRSNSVGAWSEPSCKNGKIQENVALCKDKIIHVPSRRELRLPYFLHHARSAAAGVTDRIVYVLDAKGDLFVLDTRWETAADDDARLLLWSKGADHVDILAGNARRLLASVALSGQLQAFLMQEQLYVLYCAPYGSAWVWGVEKIDMTDFSVRSVGEETVVSNPSEIPDALELADGNLRIWRGPCLLAEIRD